MKWSRHTIACKSDATPTIAGVYAKRLIAQGPAILRACFAGQNLRTTSRAWIARSVCCSNSFSDGSACPRTFRRTCYSLLADLRARPLSQLPQLRPCTAADARRHDRASRHLHRMRSRPPCVRALPSFRSKSQQPVLRTAGGVGQRQGEIQLLRLLRGAHGCESHLTGAEQSPNRRTGRVSQPLQGLRRSAGDLVATHLAHRRREESASGGRLGRASEPIATSPH